MTKSRVIGLVLMAAGVCAHGTAPDWLALSIVLLGFAVTLLADGRYLRFAIARRQFGFLINRVILLTALVGLGAIYVLRLISIP
jgi:hypothetical protein